MPDYQKLYEFAASLGAFEGYVYGKRQVHELNLDALENWSNNIVTAYRHFRDEVRRSFQDQCNQTAGRAIRSIEPVLGNQHPITQRLYAIITPDQPLPDSPDAFNKKKWFTNEHGQRAHPPQLTAWDSERTTINKQLPYTEDSLYLNAGNFNPESAGSLKEGRKVISGTVVTGTKRAAFFTQLEWVKTQCLTLLGFEPYPGTLNIQLTELNGQVVAELRKIPGVPLVPPDEAYCKSQVYPVQIGNIPGAIILPEENVRLHGCEIVEILAPVFLREALNIQDGNQISFIVMENPILEIR
jgi:CTP-dependent riboflavin kinase